MTVRISPMTDAEQTRVAAPNEQQPAAAGPDALSHQHGQHRRLQRAGVITPAARNLYSGRNAA